MNIFSKEVKEFLHWALFWITLFLQALVFVVLIANIALPIVLMVWLKSGWWLCLYLVEPVLIYVYVWLDNATDDM